MRARMPWGVLAAGSLSAAVFVYACAVGPSGDCSENGTCAAPPEGGTDAAVDAAARVDSASGLDAHDGGSLADSGSETPSENDADADSEVDSDVDADAGAEGEALDAPNGDALADADASPVCNPKQTPSQEPCVIDDLYGVFVSPNGSDANSGTRAQPARTIGHGMVLAGARGQRVYVCTGTYAETLVVSALLDGASVYGGLDCATWTYGAANKVIVAPPQTGYALQVADLRVGATFEDIEFDARDAINLGESSVAVFVRTSQNVALHRVVIVAGKAMGAAGVASGDGGAGDGATGEGGDGEGGADASNHYAGPLDGVGAMNGVGGATLLCTCPDGTSSTGGQGGFPATPMNPIGLPPGAGLPSYGVAGGGASGIDMLGCNAANASGGTGADAPSPAADTPNASLGVLLDAGWAPGTATAGSDGQPGQGGGGGGYGNGGGGGPRAGGGGACGGCGGVGGRPGGGGGASIALLLRQSAVALVGCTLTARDAGNGGPGGDGEVGQAGGFGGTELRSGCPGGGGGAGSGGNGGQGGPGGLSLGVGWLSTSPMIEGSYVAQAQALAGIILGRAGSGGPKGVGGPAAPFTTGLPGIDGTSGKNGTAQAVQGL